jgi:hypothetical protein
LDHLACHYYRFRLDAGVRKLRVELHKGPADCLTLYLALHVLSISITNSYRFWITATGSS